MISLTCTNCKTVIEMDDAFAGGVCRCRHCGAIQTVPSHLKKPGTRSDGGRAGDGKSNQPARTLVADSSARKHELAGEATTSAPASGAAPLHAAPITDPSAAHATSAPAASQRVASPISSRPDSSVRWIALGVAALLVLAIGLFLYLCLTD